MKCLDAVIGNSSITEYNSPIDWISHPTQSAVDSFDPPRNFTIGVTVGAPEVIEVPKDLYYKVLEELRARQSELLQFRDYGVADHITDIVREFEKLDEN